MGNAKMESATSKFLKNCSKIIPESDVNLTLHFKSHLHNYKQKVNKDLHSQDEHYARNKIQQVTGKNGEIECKFCFVKSVPKFKVQRIRKKGEKRVTKIGIYECRRCKKRTIDKEILPQLDRSKPKQEQQTKQTTLTEKSKKKKKKKDVNAGLIIPIKSELPKSVPKKPVAAFQNMQLKNLFTKTEEDSVSTMSRLEQMLK